MNWLHDDVFLQGENDRGRAYHQRALPHRLFLVEIWNMSTKSVVVMFALLMGFLAESSSFAYGGSFDLVHFISPGDFAIGLEPELGLSNGASVGANLKYTQGLNELSNVSAILGTSSGRRKFQLGGNMTFDIFPDLESQPGIGIAASTIYYQLPDAGQVELTAIPYIHKTFRVGGGGEVEPFLSVPFGLAFSEGRYSSVSNMSVGSLFKSGENLRFVMELGVAINNSESYFSGGIVYYH